MQYSNTYTGLVTVSAITTFIYKKWTERLVMQSINFLCHSVENN